MRITGVLSLEIGYIENLATFHVADTISFFVSSTEALHFYSEHFWWHTDWTRHVNICKIFFLSDCKDFLCIAQRFEALKSGVVTSALHTKCWWTVLWRFLTILVACRVAHATVCWLVHHFVPQWNVYAAIRWHDILYRRSSGATMRLTFAVQSFQEHKL